MNITDSTVITRLSGLTGDLRHVKINTSKTATGSDNPFAASEPTVNEDGYVQRPDRKTSEFANSLDESKAKAKVHEFDNATNYIYLTKTFDLEFFDANGNVLNRANVLDVNGRIDPNKYHEVLQRLENFVWSRKNGWRAANDHIVYRKVQPITRTSTNGTPVMAGTATQSDANAPY